MIMSETQEQQRRETTRQKHKWNGEMEGKCDEELIRRRQGASQKGGLRKHQWSSMPSK